MYQLVRNVPEFSTVMSITVPDELWDKTHQLRSEMKLAKSNYLLRCEQAEKSINEILNSLNQEYSECLKKEKLTIFELEQDGVKFLLVPRIVRGDHSLRSNDWVNPSTSSTMLSSDIDVDSSQKSSESIDNEVDSDNAMDLIFDDYVEHSSRVPLASE